MTMIQMFKSTGLTPNDARKPQNELTVYLNMTLKQNTAENTQK